MVSRSAMAVLQICAANLSSRSACERASISRPRSLAAARTAMPPTSRLRASRACAVSSSICCCAAARMRAPSLLAAPLACSTRSRAACCACSMMWLARSRASRTIVSAWSRAAASSCSPFSAAASPCAILRWRSSMTARMRGQIHFIVPKTSKANTSICTMSGGLMFTSLTPAESRQRAGSSVRRLQRAHEGIREREEQRKADADHRHRVQQARDQEHLHPQHRQQLRLARGALDEATAQDAEADGGAERSHAEDDADGQHGHGLDVCNVFHSTLLETNQLRKDRVRRPGRSMMLVCHRQIDDRQDREYEGLDGDDENVEYRPDEREDELADDFQPASQGREAIEPL